MTDRERLVELLMMWFLSKGDNNAHPKERIDALAKYLIRGGVTVQKQGEADNIKVLFIGTEQPDRSKEIYTFVFDFKINGVDYHYRQKLTPELFKTFEFKKEKHGRWEEWWPGICLIMTGEEMLYRCSACDAKYADIEGKNYCPNCGAKMDGEADE